MLSYYIKEARKRPFTFLINKLRDSLLSKVIHFNDGKMFSPYSYKKEIVINKKFDFPFALKNLSFLNNEIFEDEVDILLKKADALVMGEFQFLGSKVMKIETPINWNKDYSTGHEWEQKYFTQYNYEELICLDIDSDVKMPWELARLQFLPVLALAYKHKGDKKYLDALFLYLEDWMNSNPIGWGVGWRSTMETSLRAINLIWVLFLIEDELREHKIYKKLLSNLFQHGLFIERNIEYSDINGNHHSSCLLGQLYLGLLFKENNKVANGWYKNAFSKLEKEIILETFEDGICFEGSISYHRLVAEFFAHSAILVRKNGDAFSQSYMERLYKMLDAPKFYSKATGMCPLFGDNDDGQVLEMGGCHLNDHLYLCELKNLIFSEKLEVFKSYNYKPHLDTFWLMPNELENALPSAIKLDNSEIPSKAFEESGFFILRDKDDYAIIDCGDVGLKGRGSHGHNDLLSIELCLNGVDVIVDKGNGAYTRSSLNRLKDLSSNSHNTPVVDRAEYAAMRTTGFILSKNPSFFEVQYFDLKSLIFCGRIEYIIEGKVVKIDREIILNKGQTSLGIKDKVVIDKDLVEKEVNWNWLLSPIWKNLDDNNFLFKEEITQKKLSIELEGDVDFEIEKEMIYPTYNFAVPTNKFIYKTQLKDTISVFNTKIRLIS